MQFINRRESARQELAAMLGDRIDDLDLVGVLAAIDAGLLSAEQAMIILGIVDADGCRCMTVCDLLWEAA